LTFTNTVVGCVPAAVSRADHGADFERQALALPADPADPLLVNWVKPPVNPIIEG
jgi:hypothetical protein